MNSYSCGSALRGLLRRMLFVGFLLGCAGSATAAPPPYGVVRLPNNYQCWKANAQGQVAATYSTPDGYSHIVRWEPSTNVTSELAVIEGWPIINAMTSAGDIAGTFGGSGPRTNVFLWNGTAFQDLGAVPGSTAMEVFDMNSSRTIIGRSIHGSNSPRPFIWSQGVYTDPSPQGAIYTNLQAINNAGDIIGAYWDDSTWEKHNFFLHDGVIQEIAIPNAWNVDLVSLNNLGQVLVYWNDEFANYAGVWQDGVLTDLGNLGYPFAIGATINDNGQVIGVSATSDGRTTGFLWQAGVMTDLGAENGTSFLNVLGINAAGDVLATKLYPEFSDASLMPVTFLLWRNGHLYEIGDLLSADQSIKTLRSAWAIGDDGRVLARDLRTNEKFECALMPLLDSDSDGMPDTWETIHNLNPYSASDAAGNGDADGLTNQQEYVASTDPWRPDSDSDGMPDGWEVQHGFNPRSPADAAFDDDRDGLTTFQEYQIGTNPKAAFILTDLGLPDEKSSHVVGINAAGHVLYSSWDSSDTPHAVLSGYGDIGTFGVGAIPNGLNDSDAIVGHTYDEDGPRGFLWTPGSGFSELLINGARVIPEAINNLGQIVMVDAYDSNPWYFWDAGNVTPITPPTTPLPSTLNCVGISDSGDVLANYFDNLGNWSFRWKAGVATPLQTAGMSSIEGYGITLQGQIVGTYKLANASSRIPFVLNSNGFSTLPNEGVGQPDLPFASNDWGVAVGGGGRSFYVDRMYTNWVNEVRGLIWIRGKVTDLNSLTSMPAGFVIENAYGINHAGQIAANAIFNSAQRAVLLQPVTDNDVDGMSNDWETYYSLNPGNPADASADPDEDGFTNLQEYMAGTNPRRYLDATTLELTVTNAAAAAQTGAANHFLPMALEVQVTKDGVPCPINAPVKFTVSGLGGGLSVTDPNDAGAPASALQQTVTAYTDGQGRARVYYKQPKLGSVTTQITVTVGSGSPSVTPVTFSATTDPVQVTGDWRFNEMSGTVAIDQSGLENDGVLAGIGYTTGFQGSGSLQFDGGTSQQSFSVTNAFGQVLPSNNANPFSIAFWIKPADIPTGSCEAIFSNEDATQSSGFRIVIDNGLLDPDNTGQMKLIVASNQTGGSIRIVSGDPVSPGQWHHIVVTHTVSDTKLYIDGSLAASQPGVIIGSNAVISIGKAFAGISGYSGAFDQLKTWVIELTDADISALYADDSDNDQLPDWWEWKWFLGLGHTGGTNLDGDSLSDSDEWNMFYRYGILLDPTKSQTIPGINDGDGDYDVDGVSDKVEFAAGTNPASGSDYPAGDPNLDLDHDRLRDSWEVAYFGDRAVYSGNDNPDGDRLTNEQEQLLGTNPLLPKTGAFPDGLADQDGDSVIDIWELEDGTDPHDDTKFDVWKNFVQLRGRMEHLNNGQFGPGGVLTQYGGTVMRATAIEVEGAQRVSPSLPHGIINEVTGFTNPSNGTFIANATTMRFRKGVRYRIELIAGRTDLPVVSGKFYWSNTPGNDDEPNNKFIAYEVEGRQWYQSDVNGVPQAVDPVAAQTADPRNFHFTQWGTVYSGSPETRTYDKGTLIILPMVDRIWERDNQDNEAPTKKPLNAYSNWMAPAADAKRLFVGTEASGKAELNIRVKPAINLEAVRVLVGLKAKDTLLNDFARVGANGVAELNTSATLSALEDSAVYKVVIGADANNDSKLDLNEAQETPFTVTIVPPSEYQVVASALSAILDPSSGSIPLFGNLIQKAKVGFDLPNRPMTQAFLKRFINESATIYDVAASDAVPYKVEDVQITHVAGSSYSGGTTQLPYYRFPDGSFISDQMEASVADTQRQWGLPSVIRKFWGQNANAIKQYFIDNPGVNQHTFAPIIIPQGESFAFNLPDNQDFKTSFGGVNFGQAGQLTFVVKRDPLNPNKVAVDGLSLTGVIRDVYDFDWTRGAATIASRFGSVAQIGWNPAAGRNVGAIFAVDVDLNATFDSNSPAVQGLRPLLSVDLN